MQCDDRPMADLPVGVLLSGGLDSSLIAAMAAGGGRPINTFTMRFPGFRAGCVFGIERLFALVILKLWQREYAVSL